MSAGGAVGDARKRQAEQDAPAPDLDAIRARAEAATPGPWKVAEDDYPQPDDSKVLAADGPIGGCPDCGVRAGYSRVDAEFIAAARTDIPLLLDALDAARQTAEDNGYRAVAAESRAASLEATLATVRAEHTRDRERLAKVQRLSGPFPCCVHCPGDPIHDVGRDEHAVACPACARVADLRAALATTSEEAPDA